MEQRAFVQIFKQLANARGTRLYKLQKKFQAVFGFTLREFEVVRGTREAKSLISFSTNLAAIFFGRGLFNCTSPSFGCPRSCFEDTHTLSM